MANTTMKITIKSLSILILSTTMLASCETTSKSTSASTTKAAGYNASLGARYLQRGQYKLAHSKLTKAVQQNPNDASAHHYLAILHQRLNQNGEAMSSFKKALSLDSKNPEIRNNYGSFLCSQGQSSSAIKQFELALADPLYETPQFAQSNMGKCLLKSGKTAEAEKLFQAALQKGPTSTALVGMADILSQRGEYTKAQAFIMRDSNNSEESLKLCYKINQHLGETAMAEQCKQKFATKYPSKSL